MKAGWSLVFRVGLATGAAASPLAAQPAPDGPHPGRPGPFGAGEGGFGFLWAQDASEGKLVKGAPYSAEAITEVVQALADGNRIVRKISARVYRDGSGRTRREQTVAAVG